MTQIMLARLDGWGQLNKVLDGERPLDALDDVSSAELIPISEEITALLDNARKLEVNTYE